MPGTRAEAVYGEPVVYERHRHRYEVNPAYHEALSGKGMVFSGMSPDGRLVEIIELEGHPFFMAGQFHPELRSRPTRPHPLFREFVGAAKALAQEAPHRTVVLPGLGSPLSRAGSEAWSVRRPGTRAVATSASRTRSRARVPSTWSTSQAGCRTSS